MLTTHPRIPSGGVGFRADGPITYGGESREVKRQVISIGLIAGPDLPAEIAEDLADQLPGLLADKVDAETRCVVSVREPLPVRERPKALIKTIRQ